MTIETLLDRRVPLAVMLALFLQGGTAVWWAATKDSDDRFQQQRIDHMETTISQTGDNQQRIIERLARIEERVNAEAHMLDRIEKQTGASHR